MRLTMKNTGVLIGLLVLLLAGCSSEEVSSLAQQQMILAGVHNVVVQEEGSAVVVFYEPEDVDYEGRIISDWGAILGVLKTTYPSAESYRIVQLFDSEKIAELTVSASDVSLLSEGKITLAEFRNRVVFKGGAD